MSYEDELMMQLRNGEYRTMYDIVFDVVRKVSGRLDATDGFRKVFSPFLLCRYVSMIPGLEAYSEILNIVNSQGRLTPEQFYRIAYEIVPKRERYFLKYIKRDKSDNPKTINNVNETGSAETKISLFDI